MTHRWIFVAPFVLQLACLATESSDEDQADEPESITVKQSALTLEAPKFPISEIPMEVVNVNSQKCLDVAGSGTGNGSNIQQYTCNLGRNQTFLFTPAGPDSYQIRAGHVAGMNVDVAGGSLIDNANIQLYSVVSDAQLFGLVRQSDGSYEIVSKKSGKCLDVANASPADGANVQQYTCFAAATNQRWFLRPRFVDLNLIAAHSGKCMQIATLATDDQIKAQQNVCSGAANQAWSLGQSTTVNGTTFYNLRVSHSGKCLDVAGASFADGAAIQQYRCATGPLADNQLWSLTENADGYLTIKNKRSGKCLDVPGVSQNNAVNLQQYSCNGGANQRWYASIFSDRHIQVVQVARSSGADRLFQDDNAISDHLARYGGVYNPYGFRLSYSPSGDKSTVDSDALFHLGEGGTYTCPDASVGTPDFCAERYAFNFPNKLVVFSRPGGSYSAGNASYMVVGALGSKATFVCNTDVADTQVLAREFGHHMGLADTFAFSGDDLITDTLPDPQADSCLAPHTATGLLNGTTTVATDNVMSRYYNDSLAITPMQAGQARAGAYVRRTGYFGGRCGGLSQITCPSSTQLCELATNGCSLPNPVGACVTKPTSCEHVVAPVCGCDGRTYANDCERQAAGVSKWFDGVCSNPTCPPAGPPQSGTPCTQGPITCVYSVGPSPPTCVHRFSCLNAHWSDPTIVCGG